MDEDKLIRWYYAAYGRGLELTLRHEAAHHFVCLLKGNEGLEVAVPHMVWDKNSFIRAIELLHQKLGVANKVGNG